MIPGTTDSPSNFAERLLARWEVSWLGSTQNALTMLVLPVPFVAAFVMRAAGLSMHHGILGVALVLWVAVIVADLARSLWLILHPLASPRWLQALHAAVGPDLSERASELLRLWHGHRLDGQIRRADMVEALHVARVQRREALAQSKRSCHQDPQSQVA